MVLLDLPASYPFVLLPIVASFYLNLHHVLATYPARKKAGVKVPRQYANWDEAEKNPQGDLMQFNIAQRSHANFLESYPSFLLAVLITGLEYSRFATIAGMAWVLARYILHRGYNSGDVKWRTVGGLPATLTLMSLWIGSTISLYQLLSRGDVTW